MVYIHLKLLLFYLCKKIDFFLFHFDYYYQMVLVASIENVDEILHKYGVAIIPSILDDDECDKMNNGIWDTLETLTQKFDIPMKRDNPKTWIEMQKIISNAFNANSTF